MKDWAEKWNIPDIAIQELMYIFANRPIGNSDRDHTETDVQNIVRLEASRAGVTLFRNNVGAMMTSDNRFIRFGLANESKQMNQEYKSSDLIGIRPIEITEQHVGLRIGQFVAREIKSGNWKISGNAHEQAQLKFISLIAANGGDACFADGEGTI